MDQVAYRQFLELDRSHWWMRGRRRVYLGLLEHFLGAARPRRVLDLGAGVGGFLEGLRDLAAEGGRVFPADIDTESLGHIAARGFPGGVVLDGHALPYRDASFDLVCAFDAIEHTEDDLAVVAEAARILAPGGHLFVSVPAYQFLYANNDRVVHHKRRYRRRRLNDLFERAGLEAVHVTHTNVLLFPLILPAVLAIKAWEKLSPAETEADHTNLTWPLPRAVHTLFAGLFAAELLLTRHMAAPVGHSIAALARKPCTEPGSHSRTSAG